MESKRDKEIVRRLGVDKRTAMFILKNKELCDRILGELPISRKLFLDKYNITATVINRLIHGDVISSFRMSLTGPVFIFEKEALSFIGDVNYSKPINIRASMLRYFDVVKVGLNKRDELILHEHLLGHTDEYIANEFGLTRTRIQQLKRRAESKVKLYYSRLAKYDTLQNENMTLVSEIRMLLKVKNSILKRKGLKGVKLSKSLPLLSERLIDLDLTVRCLNCLKAAEIETLGDLVNHDKNDMLKFRNFGKRTLIELEDLVESKGLKFGMNVY